MMTSKSLTEDTRQNTPTKRISMVDLRDSNASGSKKKARRARVLETTTQLFSSASNRMSTPKKGGISNTLTPRATPCSTLHVCPTGTSTPAQALPRQPTMRYKTLFNSAMMSKKEEQQYDSLMTHAIKTETPTLKTVQFPSGLKRPHEMLADCWQYTPTKNILLSHVPKVSPHPLEPPSPGNRGLDGAGQQLQDGIECFKESVDGSVSLADGVNDVIFRTISLLLGAHQLDAVVNKPETALRHVVFALVAICFSANGRPSSISLGLFWSNIYAWVTGKRPGQGLFNCDPQY